MSQSKKNKQNAVLIIAYSAAPSKVELASFEQCIKILGKHPICLVCPISLDTSIYQKLAEKYDKNLQIFTFHDAYFKSVKSYNRLMLSVEFYERFILFEYILLYQLDAWVFKDELDDWANGEYDYYGAPWFVGHNSASESSPLMHVAGNGGFSLRCVKSCIKLLSTKVPYEHEVKSSIEGAEPVKKIRNVTIMSVFMKTGGNEDTLFAEYGPTFCKDFKAAPPEKSIAFSFEVNPRVLFKMNNNKLPFGCHAFEKYDWEFWQDKILI